MDMEQVKCVLAVAQFGSFTEAAFELFISQSTISKKIYSLEKELGVCLFNRTTRSISLTPAGKAFVKHGEKLMSEYCTLLHNVKEIGHAEVHHLTIGKIYFAQSNSIIQELAEFSKEHPDIMLETIDGTTSPLAEAVLDSIIDVAFVSSMYPLNSAVPISNFSEDKRFISHSISKDPYFVVVSRNHYLAAKTSLDYCDLKNEKFITLDKNMEVYHKAISKAFENEGITPNLYIRCGSIPDALALISKNVGIGIFSPKAITDSTELVLIPLEKTLIRDTQIIIRNEKRIPYPIQTFFNYFKKIDLNNVS